MPVNGLPFGRVASLLGVTEARIEKNGEKWIEEHGNGLTVPITKVAEALHLRVSSEALHLAERHIVRHTSCLAYHEKKAEPFRFCLP